MKTLTEKESYSCRAQNEDIIKMQKYTSLSNHKRNSHHGNLQKPKDI